MPAPQPITVKLEPKLPPLRKDALAAPLAKQAANGEWQEF
jgi:hypothetical protein